MISVVSETETSVVFGIVINEADYAREITSAVVYDADVEVVASAVVDFADEAAISITGLVVESGYDVVFTFDDGYEDYVSIETAAAPAAE